METTADRRRRKLISLIERHGLVRVADASGKSAAYLDQITKGTLLPAKKDGTRSARNLGDPAAQAIEEAFSLGRGWFDADDISNAAPPPQKSLPNPDSLTDALEVLSKALSEVDPDTRVLVGTSLSMLASDPSKLGITSHRIRALLGAATDELRANDHGHAASGMTDRLPRGIGPGNDSTGDQVDQVPATQGSRQK
jgi:hypothetical protein